MKRDAAQTIFRTVVFAGAMLGAGCSKKAPATTPTAPTNNTTATETQDATPTTGEQTATPDPCAGASDPCAGGDPCAGRPRGSDEDGGGGMGRGFILS